MAGGEIQAYRDLAEAVRRAGKVLNETIASAGKLGVEVDVEVNNAIAGPFVVVSCQVRV